MKPNPVRDKLKNGESVTCFWATMGLPFLAEAVAHWNFFDCILLDAQHGYWTNATLLNSFQVIDRSSAVPLVRVVNNDPGLIGRALDAGAMGVMVPMVNSPEEAEAAVAAMRYPPEGRRSAGGSRLTLYAEDYFQKANSAILTMVMIETKEAVERAEEILSVPGVDLGFVGPGDLAISLGCAPQRGPVHEAALERVAAAGEKVGTPVGILCMTEQEGIRRIQQGYRFIPYVTDFRILQKAVTECHQNFEALKAKL